MITEIISLKTDDSHQKYIRNALNVVESQTCIEFVPRNDEHEDFVFVQVSVKFSY